jgi:uncharacterized delta-60 repeat protein
VGCAFTTTVVNTFPSLVRYNTNGTLDKSFGPTQSGSIIYTSNPGAFNGLVLESNGKIVCAGQTIGNLNWMLSRLNPDGTIDTSYGTNGIVTTTLPGPSQSATSIVIQTNNFAIAGGFSGSPTKFNLARYVSDTPSPSSITTYSASQAGSLFIPAPGLLSNKPAGSVVILLTNPSNGILSISANGSFVYVPNADFSGIDSFTYTISNNGVISSTVYSVNIIVAPDPTVATSGIGAELVNAIRKKYGTRT